jgi:hypothetical protein
MRIYLVRRGSGPRFHPTLDLPRTRSPTLPGPPLRADSGHEQPEATYFQRTIRDLFLSADATLAKNYLRFLVDGVTVRGNELEIRGRTDAVVALLASGSDAASAAVVNRPETVLVTAGGWLQSLDSKQAPAGESNANRAKPTETKRSHFRAKFPPKGPWTVRGLMRVKGSSES